MTMTELQKKEYQLRAVMEREKLKGDAEIAPSDRADAELAIKAATLYLQSGVIRHGVTKLFAEDASSFFRQLSALKRFDAEERDFFERTAAILTEMFPPEGKKRRSRRTGKR